MKRIIVILIALIFCGCYCRRCQGQEALKGEAVEVARATITATEVVEWKKTIYKGLNVLTRDPFSAVCDLFLLHAFGISSIPSIGKPATIPTEGKARMDMISQSINASLGFAIVAQYRPPEENRAAISAAIAAATDTITDVKQREAFLRKAQLLNKE